MSSIVSESPDPGPRTSSSPGPRGPARLIDEGANYSKDYWDLVFEQLAHRGMFKFGMWVLAVLYGLAIFAPLIGNDRPYKLVAIDYGGYERANRAIGGLVGAAVDRIAAAQTEADLEQAATASERELEAVSVRIETMRTYLPAQEHPALNDLEAEFQSLVASAREGRAPPQGELDSLASAALAVSAEYVSTGPKPTAESTGKRLIAHRSYPLAEGLGWGSVVFIVLWVMLVTYPGWSKVWNRGWLGGDRERIRDHRRYKLALVIGVPALAGLLWAALIGGGAPAFDLSPYKRALTDGTMVAVEPPLLAPVPIGYSETHNEENFRPPTWLASSRLDSNGRYMTGLRVAKPDPITGYLPPPTPTEVRFGEAWPNAPHRHLAGTDELGRDFFVRLLWGGRVSLAVGILSAFLLTVIGVVLGSLAGYFGGWVDVVIMRVIEVLQSIPAFFLILASLAFIDPNKVGIPPIMIVVVVIALVRWTGTARLVRGEFLRLREQEFVLAARALGFSNLRTIFRHVLPNALSPVLVSAAFAVASGILTESAVSFLGFGVQHPEASWGSLVNESKSPEFWWVQVFPGVLIFVTVTCYNLVGDAIRDALDPKMKV
ncbi:ABC transporter permease [Engelhardtia mirabilis]|uniref:Oligopeptide transport system permease protein OppC n=1 Tax=Engelhardtia mirabilis TaxID=2528011 RepID=A0A518BI52_9BACT|nr:Oligopeptide transport system permease protein OppC [Planctomycetes bacterium Pla133]QDV00983.1 Oligopeptide transport system permease protein OppC [Planctomycetes bacterium Pla86]